MFKYKGTREQLHEERQKNAQLNVRLDKAGADLEYIAMMSDIELDGGGENEETEADNNE